MAADTGERREAGFELDGTFYPWRYSDHAKDLMLTDHFTSGMPLDEFAELANSDSGRKRGPIQLALIATSVRAGNPDWSVRRVIDVVENLTLSDDLEMVDGDDDASPPAVTETAVETGPPTSDSSDGGSSPSSTPPVASESETSYAIPV